ncbi:MAG: DJ-1/PfpI family protein [Bacteroidales bacterium]|nr:DJ-1/PfpI family protein [Bacteroidales bacterium]
MKKVYIFLADGFELIEALAPYDIFRRGGIDVKTVSVTEQKIVSASNKVKVEADITYKDSDFSDADLIYLPGGYPGYENLCNNKIVGEIAINQYKSGKFLAAICAGPTVLLKNKIGLGKKVTSHSCCKAEMSENYQFTGNDVEQDGNLFTSTGAGQSIKFGLFLAQALCGDEVLAKIKNGMEIK